MNAIASGVSRFLLALKACFFQAEPAGTLVFDIEGLGGSASDRREIAPTQSTPPSSLCHQPRQWQTATSEWINTITKPSSPLLTPVRTVVRVTTLDNFTTRREELATSWWTLCH